METLLEELQKYLALIRHHLVLVDDSLSRANDQLEEDEPGESGIRYIKKQIDFSADHVTDAKVVWMKADKILEDMISAGRREPGFDSLRTSG